MTDEIQTVVVYRGPGWAVMVQSLAGLNPPGPRLTRTEPLPFDVWDGFATKAEAADAAAALADYINANAPGRKKKRKR